MHHLLGAMFFAPFFRVDKDWEEDVFLLVDLFLGFSAAAAADEFLLFLLLLDSILPIGMMRRTTRAADLLLLFSYIKCIRSIHLIEKKCWPGHHSCRVRSQLPKPNRVLGARKCVFGAKREKKGWSLAYRSQSKKMATNMHYSFFKEGSMIHNFMRVEGSNFLFLEILSSIVNHSPNWPQKWGKKTMKRRLYIKALVIWSSSWI